MTDTVVVVGSLVRYKGDPSIVRRVTNVHGNGTVVAEPGGYYNVDSLEVIRRVEIDGVIIEGPDS